MGEKTEGKLGLIVMGGAMLSKSLIQFSVDGWSCVPSLLFDLRPNYGGGNEDNGHLLQKVPCRYCCTQCPRPCSRPPPTHTSAADSWTLMDKSGSVSCGVTDPFSCVLVHTRQPPPRGLMPYPGLLYPESLPLWQTTDDSYLHRRHSNTVLTQSLWGLWVLVCTRFV